MRDNIQFKLLLINSNKICEYLYAYNMLLQINLNFKLSKLKN